MSFFKAYIAILKQQAKDILDTIVAIWSAHAVILFYSACLVLVLLKCVGLLPDLDWWWVVAPFWLPQTLLISVVIIIAAIYSIFSSNDRDAGVSKAKDEMDGFYQSVPRILSKTPYNKERQTSYPVEVISFIKKNQSAISAIVEFTIEKIKNLNEELHVEYSIFWEHVFLSCPPKTRPVN